MVGPKWLEWTFLRENPFRLAAPTTAEQVTVWAGMPEVRARFEDLLGRALTDAESQVVLTYGPWGSGKTHAAYFYSDGARLPNVNGMRVREYHSMVCVTPDDPSKAPQALYVEILDRLRLSRIMGYVKAAIDESGADQVLDALQERTGSEDIGRAVWLLGQVGSDSERRALTRSYILENRCSRSELRKLDVSRNITTTQDRFAVIAGVFQCIIGFAPSTDIRRHTRMVLWIDEMEDLILYPARYYLQFTQGIRFLADKLPSYFTLIMNFTFTGPTGQKDIGAVLGSALLDRVTETITITPVDVDAALQYVRELLAAYRSKDFPKAKLAETYPFETAGVRALVEGLPTRTPRAINRRCSIAIAAAMRDRVLSGKGRGSISAEFIRALAEEAPEKT